MVLEKKRFADAGTFADVLTALHTGWRMSLSVNNLSQLGTAEDQTTSNSGETCVFGVLAHTKSFNELTLNIPSATLPYDMPDLRAFRDDFRTISDQAERVMSEYKEAAKANFHSDYKEALDALALLQHGDKFGKNWQDDESYDNAVLKDVLGQMKKTVFKQNGIMHRIEIANNNLEGQLKLYHASIDKIGCDVDSKSIDAAAAQVTKQVDITVITCKIAQVVRDAAMEKNAKKIAIYDIVEPMPELNVSGKDILAVIWEEAMTY